MKRNIRECLYISDKRIVRKIRENKEELLHILKELEVTALEILKNQEKSDESR